MGDDGIQRRRDGNGQEIAKHYQVSQGAVGDQSEAEVSQSPGAESAEDQFLDRKSVV